MMGGLIRGPAGYHGSMSQGGAGGPLRPQPVPANFLSPEAMQRNANGPSPHDMYRAAN